MSSEESKRRLGQQEKLTAMLAKMVTDTRASGRLCVILW